MQHTDIGFENARDLFLKNNKNESLAMDESIKQKLAAII
jgi:hypothetical protein